jgi:hypothetical protein
MTHLHYAPPSKGKNRRSAEKLPAHSKPVRNGRMSGSRVVIFEAVHHAQEIIRVSIETASYARPPERVIAF